MYTARKGIHAAFISVLAVCSPLQATPTLDLAGSGISGASNSVVFRPSDPEPAGTDYLRCFIRLESEAHVSPGDDPGAPRLPFGGNPSSESIQSLLLRDVPIVNSDSTDYRQFLLAIRKSSAADSNLSSLKKLEFYLGAAGSLLERPSFAGKIYRLAEATNR